MRAADAEPRRTVKTHDRAITPMTLGNMRANGVRNLIVYCGACPRTVVFAANLRRRPCSKGSATPVAPQASQDKRECASTAAPSLSDEQRTSSNQRSASSIH
jgi:hypothetical protein